MTLCARSDDLINVSAHRLGTGLIEQVVTGHPEVTECCVVGAPDKLKGQSPFALVALSTSSSLSGKTSTSAHDENAAKILKSINEHVRKELGPIAQLSGLVVAAKLPKTRSGKSECERGRGSARQEARQEARNEGERTGMVTDDCSFSLAMRFHPFSLAPDRPCAGRERCRGQAR